MLHNPDVQTKIQQELDIYFADLHRPVTMTDRSSLPYTAAALMVLLYPCCQGLNTRVFNAVLRVGWLKEKSATV